MKPIYFKTDKNGTKYFYDYTCPRCSGYGMLDKWINTGKVCYACGGSGKRAVAKIVKEYTPEYWDKLQARRMAKSEKQKAEAAKYAKEHADEIEEQNRKIIEKRYADHGCGADGVGFVLTGNTFPIKDQIKKSGGRWIYGVWICPVAIEADGVSIKKIDLSGHVGGGSVAWIDDFNIYDAIFD